MASTRSSRDLEPGSEPRRRSALGVLTFLLALYAAVFASLSYFGKTTSGSGGPSGDTGSLDERFDAQARRLRTEVGDDLDKRLKDHTEKLATAAKRVKDAGKVVQAVAESTVKRADE